VYRQLRKAQEDGKNEPRAADFYFGEMEMRRHALSTPLPERLILAAYWLVSGYGLRAMRAFAALTTLIVGATAVMQDAGFSGLRPGYLDSLLYAVGSVLSLSLTIGHLSAVLTDRGDAIRILLRIGGPVLLGLAALALRGASRDDQTRGWQPTETQGGRGDSWCLVGSICTGLPRRTRRPPSRSAAMRQG
jgi:hypothetical protein